MAFKKIAATAASVLTVAALSVSALAATFGKEELDGTKQGENGFYYLYSTETNKGKAFDTKTLKECALGYDTAMAGWFGELWQPANDKDEWADGVEWFFVSDADGSVVGGGYTAAIGYKAPDGELIYDVDVNVWAGNKAFGTDENEDKFDGVTILIFRGTKLLWAEVFKGEVETMSINLQEPLAKGEMLYFVVDPNADWGNDTARLEISVNKTVLTDGGADKEEGGASAGPRLRRR